MNATRGGDCGAHRLAKAASQDDLGKRERKNIAIQWAKYEGSKSYAIEYESVIPKATVKQVADALDDVLTQYSLVFKFKPTEKLKVKFLDSPNTYEQEGGNPSNPAHFNPGSEYLVIQQMPFYQLIPTVYHEACHHDLHFYVGRGVPIPIWFNEGMAMYYEGIQQNKGTKKLDYKLIDSRKLRMVKDKVMTRTALSLEKLIDSTYEQFHDKENPQLESLHYNQSLSVIHFFMNAMGGARRPVHGGAASRRTPRRPRVEAVRQGPQELPVRGRQVEGLHGAGEGDDKLPDRARATPAGGGLATAVFPFPFPLPDAAASFEAEASPLKNRSRCLVNGTSPR